MKTIKITTALITFYLLACTMAHADCGESIGPLDCDGIIHSLVEEAGTYTLEEALDAIYNPDSEFRDMLDVSQEIEQDFLDNGPDCQE